VAPAVTDGDDTAPLDALEALLSNAVRLVAFPHVSNLLGGVSDVAAAAALAHARGARLVVDSAAFAPHRRRLDSAALHSCHLFPLLSRHNSDVKLVMDKWDAAVQEYAAGMEARIRSASADEAPQTVWQLRAEASDGRWRVFLVSGSSSLFHLAKTLGRGFAVGAGGLFAHSQVAGSLPPGWLWRDGEDAPLPHLKTAAAQKQATVALTIGGASFPAATLLAQCGGLSLRVVARGAAPRGNACLYPLLPCCAGAGRSWCGRGRGCAERSISGGAHS